MTEVHIQSNDKRSPEMSLMGETIESITLDDVVKYWGKSPFYKRLLNSVKMFLVRYCKCVISYSGKGFVFDFISYPSQKYKGEENL